jgi:3-hydroxyisobutyrate dehydrogenase-like beta-hydroxyacid dehydrogenase
MTEQTGHASPTVGVVGLGAMGGPITGHLLGAGLSVVCTDLDPRRLAQYRAAGATAVNDVTDLAAMSDVVLVVVPTDGDVRSVCLGAQGILAGCRPGTAVLLCSSLTPRTCAAVAEAAPAGVAVLDAALTGGLRGAENGTINLLVGGDATVLTKIDKALEPWTHAVHHLGPLGSGQVAKTANNLVHWATICGINEAFELARRYGIDNTLLRAALQDGSTDSRTLREIESMRFTWFEKDIANAVAMAGEVGLDLPLSETALEVMRTVSVAGVASLMVANSNDR